MLFSYCIRFDDTIITSFSECSWLVRIYVCMYGFNFVKRITTRYTTY